MGQLLARHRIELVYGGGKVGLMGALADSCLEMGGRAIGVMPRALVDKEIAHRGPHSWGFLADTAPGTIRSPGTLRASSEYLPPSGSRRVPLFLKLADRAVQDGFVRCTGAWFSRTTTR